MQPLPHPQRAILSTAPVETCRPFDDAVDVVRWAHATFGSDLCVTASFGDATLPHVAATAVPGLRLTVIDTGYLFAETDWFIDHLIDTYDLDVEVIRPDPNLERNLWQHDPDACCAARKVEPLDRALADKRAWITGLRRTDSATRQTTRFVHTDLLRDVVKINPLAAWTDAHVATYAERHRLPDHPLADRDYSSIGCWPCTRPAIDDDPRSGRWVGTAKTECGLHR